MTATFDRFFDALDGLGVTWTRTTTGGFGDDLRAVVAEPAIGTPLAIEGISLDEAQVTLNPTPRELEEARTGITHAPLAIAALGTVVVQSGPNGDEPISLYPERHVAVVAASNVVEDLPNAFEWLEATFGDGRDTMIFATGASATADMGSLVEGVHGPTEVHVVVVEDR